jgi:hypothetical protein
MACYHFSVNSITRSKSETCANSLGYQVAERLTRPDGNLIPSRLVLDKERVLGHGIIGFEGTRQELADSAELAEKRKDSIVGRSITLALPSEVTNEQRFKLIKGFSLWLHERHGQAVAFAVHAPSGEGLTENHHAHIWLSERSVTNGKFSEKKIGVYQKDKSDGELLAVRSEWEKRQNRLYEKLGFAQRVSAKSHQDNGIEIEPTKHLGEKWTRLSKKGYKSEAVQENERINTKNEQRVIARIAKSIQKRRGSRKRNRVSAENVGENVRDQSVRHQRQGQPENLGIGSMAESGAGILAPPQRSVSRIEPKRTEHPLETKVREKQDEQTTSEPSEAWKHWQKLVAEKTITNDQLPESAPKKVQTVGERMQAEKEAKREIEELELEIDDDDGWSM